jgi:four helix bundle protein
MVLVLCPLPFVLWSEGDEDMALRKDFANLEVYRLSERLADEVWNMVAAWDRFSKDTVGKQMVRAADSIGANIAEGTGRGVFQDNRRFVRIARASLCETMHWLRRAHRRQLMNDSAILSIKSLVSELAPRLNAYLRSIGPRCAVDTKDPGQRTKDQEQRTKDNENAIDV